ncbi:hypothetical protein LZ554_008633 [Drepanopeziza brunnea f. sp. 'monogermtubi']|nr:hypothetical protein LZ554_008633 [Drepanopeziza brunnea f. sp. 'monogermtubi']
MAYLATIFDPPARQLCTLYVLRPWSFHPEIDTLLSTDLSSFGTLRRQIYTRVLCKTLVQACHRQLPTTLKRNRVSPYIQLYGIWMVDHTVTEDDQLLSDEALYSI